MIFSIFLLGETTVVSSETREPVRIEFVLARSKVTQSQPSLSKLAKEKRKSVVSLWVGGGVPSWSK